MSVKTSQLGVAVVGLGVGEQHARAYAALKSCRLVRLCDTDAEKARRLARGLGAAAVASSFDEIVQDPEVQVVSIASFDDAHAGQLLAALGAGKHVFVEKPMCRSAAELAAVKKAWESGGRPRLASNLVLRSAALYRWLKRAIAEGRLGEIYAFDGDYLYGRLGKITEGWRKDVEDYSVMLGGGVHLVDLMLWLTEQRPQSVSAGGNRICSEGTAFRYLDYVSAAYTFPSGLVGRISANFGCAHRHQHVLRVFGTKGTFIYDDQGARLHSSREPENKPESISAAPLPASKGELIPEFIQDVLSGTDSRPRTQTEFDVISACLAADRAVAENKSMRIDYL